MSDTPRVLRNFVNGAYVDARAEARADVVNPSTGDEQTLPFIQVFDESELR